MWVKLCSVRYGRSSRDGRPLVCRRLAGHRGRHAARLSIPELARVTALRQRGVR